MATTPLEVLTGKADSSIVEVWQARVRSSGACRFLEYGDRSWTYAETWLEARRFASVLSSHGHAPARVAAYLPNCPTLLWSWLGTLAAGAVFVPLHRGHRGAILNDMLQRSGARVLVTDSAGLDAFDCAGCDLELIVLTDGADDDGGAAAPRRLGWSAVTDARPADAVATAKPTQTACILYTSGTTGRSKAVLVPHNQFCRGASRVAETMEIGPDDCFHAWPPLYHLGAQLDVVMATVIGGGRVALIETFSASRFWAEVEHHGATLFVGFTGLLEILLKQLPRPEQVGRSLRAGLIGHVPAALRQPFEARFEVELFDVYGMTEAEPLALPKRGERPPDGACGRANPDFELVILDDDDVIAPPGCVGEIAARPLRPGVMFSGYEDDEAATLAAFRSLWFHTGDLGSLDENGFLYFKDRRKHMIRRRGENISSWELEHIVGRHPAVDGCAAVGVPSPLGEDDVKLIVALKSGASVSPQDLHAWCGGEMARFMVPRFIEIVDELPLTDTGKVRKEALRSNGPRVFDSDAEHR